MKIVFYGSGSQFQLTDEEFNNFIKEIEFNKGVYILRLEVFLTDKFIWAGRKPSDPNRRLLHDGGYAIKKFGEWYSEKSPDVKIDMRYYPELLKDIDVEDNKLLENGQQRKT